MIYIACQKSYKQMGEEMYRFSNFSKVSKHLLAHWWNKIIGEFLKCFIIFNFSEFPYWNRVHFQKNKEKIRFPRRRSPPYQYHYYDLSKKIWYFLRICRKSGSRFFISDRIGSSPKENPFQSRWPNIIAGLYFIQHRLSTGSDPSFLI